MNEITKIHLGRQAFTISVDAHKELQEYLRAIKRHMGDSDDAVEEVEIRMAELLMERGVTGDKVVLLKDVDYLKQHLGEPGDFDDEEHAPRHEDTSASKRLYRDTDNAMIAGVAAGLGKYFGIDPLWIRLAFVGLTFAGATGIIIYIILWLIVPEAKTTSDRLQMQGKPVTVDALKDVVERADVKGAARRATDIAEKVARIASKVVLGAVGLSLMLAGVIALLFLTSVGIYWALNHDLVPAHIFPATTSEVVLICLAFVAAAILASFFLIAGLAVAKRKWPLPGWALGAMVAVFLASIAISGALAADAAPKFRQRYEAAKHTYTRRVPEFHKLHVVGSLQANVRYEVSSNFGVSVKYWGNTDFSGMTTDVADQTLNLDVSKLTDKTRCQKLCIFDSPIIDVVIRGPQLEEVAADMPGTQLSIPDVHNQSIKVRSSGGWISFFNVQADDVRATRANDNTWNLSFTGDYKPVDRPQEISVLNNTASIAARNVDLTFDGKCGLPDGQDAAAHISLYDWFQKLTVNGTVVGAPNNLRQIQGYPGVSPEKCVDLMESFSGN